MYIIPLPPPLFVYCKVYFFALHLHCILSTSGAAAVFFGPPRAAFTQKKSRRKGRDRTPLEKCAGVPARSRASGFSVCRERRTRKRKAFRACKDMPPAWERTSQPFCRERVAFPQGLPPPPSSPTTIAVFIISSLRRARRASRSMPSPSGGSAFHCFRTRRAP